MDPLAVDPLAVAWDARTQALLARLPARVRQTVAWLRKPSRHAVRFAAGTLLVLGGVFSILPILGLWMLPLGLALLAEDVPGLKPRLERAARWIERRWSTRFRRQPAPLLGPARRSRRTPAKGDERGRG